MKKRNQQIAKISVFITSLFVIFLSVTYAFINLTIGGEKRQVITAGSLELELIEDENNLTITNALPMYDEVGMIQDAFTFHLQNKGTTSVNYKVKLVDITTGDKLNVNDVRYGLVKDGGRVIKSLSSLNEGIIDEGKIDANIKIEYALRLWIREDLEDNELIRDKDLSFRIDVEESQDIEVSYVGMMKKRVVNSEYWGGGTWEFILSKEGFYAYQDQITKVIFENKIDIPSVISADMIFDASEKQDGSVMAYLELLEGNFYVLHIQANGMVIANPDSSTLFSCFSNLVTIEGFEYFDVSNVEKFGGYYDDVDGYPPRIFSIFYGCPKLELNLNGLDTSSVTNMSYMFYKCHDLTSLDLSNFDTSNVTNMSYMFDGCSSLTSLNLSGFDTSNVTTMSGMFSGCSGLTSLDLSNFDTSNVTDMCSMFSRCSGLTSLDLSNFDVFYVF